MIYEAKLLQIAEHTVVPEALDSFIGVELSPEGTGIIVNAWVEDGWIMIQYRNEKNPTTDPGEFSFGLADPEEPS